MNGFRIGGVKYMTIKTDERSVYGKQVRRLAPEIPHTIAEPLPGKGGRDVCQDAASHPRGSLS